MARKNGNGTADRRLAFLEKVYLDDRLRWRKNEQRWERNDQRWEKNDQRWQKTQQVLLMMLKRIRKAEASLNSALRILYRQMEK